MMNWNLPVSALISGFHCLIEGLKGTFGKDVTTKTDYLVVASTASRDWPATHFGNKLQRAEELLANQHHIRLVPEYLFEEAIQRSLSSNL